MVYAKRIFTLFQIFIFCTPFSTYWSSHSNRENEQRVFEDTDEDLEILLNFDGELIQEIFEAIMSVNGMGEKAVVEAAKN